MNWLGENYIYIYMFSGKELDLRAPFDLLDSYELNEEEIRIRRFNEMVNEADAL